MADDVSESEVVMTDLDLLHAVEASLVGLGAFDRELYALARLRVERGEPLKATQRHQLARVVRLAKRLEEDSHAP